MYDSVAYLIGPEAVTYDDYGNPVVTTTRRMVYVQPASVYASEFYAAAQAGIHPSITFVLTNRLDYQGEKVVEWDGQEYAVIRADWTAQRDALRLVCEARVRFNPEDEESE